MVSLWTSAATVSKNFKKCTVARPQRGFYGKFWREEKHIFNFQWYKPDSAVQCKSLFWIHYITWELLEKCLFSCEEKERCTEHTQTFAKSHCCCDCHFRTAYSVSVSEADIFQRIQVCLLLRLILPPFHLYLGLHPYCALKLQQNLPSCEYRTDISITCLVDYRDNCTGLIECDENFVNRHACIEIKLLIFSKRERARCEARKVFVTYYCAKTQNFLSCAAFVQVCWGVSWASKLKETFRPNLW